MNMEIAKIFTNLISDISECSHVIHETFNPYVPNVLEKARVSVYFILGNIFDSSQLWMITLLSSRCKA